MNLKSHEERVGMLKKHIAVPYDTSGKYNGDYVAFLSAVRQRFFGNEDFVGVIPGGSCVKGNNILGSDFDMIFLGSNVRTQQSTLHEIQAISQGKFGRPSSIPFLYTFGQLEGNSDMTEPDEALDVSTRLSLLVSPIIGRVERIMHMRKKLLQEIQKSHDIQTIVHVALYEILAIDFGGAPEGRYSSTSEFSCPWYLIDSIDDDDSAALAGGIPVNKRTLSKMLDRGFTRTEINDIFDARRAMWHSRIRDFVNASGPFSNLN